jgi:hypothetical protein
MDTKRAPSPLARLRRALRRIVCMPSTALHYLYMTMHSQRTSHDVLLALESQRYAEAHPNKMTRFGLKCFSQTDEDGITLEILHRLDALAPGLYAEFGVGDGLENNTLVLAALGWRGFWVGGDVLALDIAKTAPARFAYLHAWITLDNIAGLARQGLARFGAEQADVIGLDLDGNDLYFVECLLAEGLRPKLFIVEYNARFPPPIRFVIDYDDKHTWQSDDYYGASLCSFIDLFARFGYALVCCNAQSGANAFFVRQEFLGLFPEVPPDPRAIYVPPRHRIASEHGHKVSARMVEKLLG